MRWRRSSFKAAAAVLLAASLAPSSPRTYTWALVLTPLSAQQRQHNTSKHDRHRHHAPVLAFGPTFSVGVVPHQRVLFSGWPMTTMLSSGSSSEDPRPPKQQPVAKIEKVRKQLVPVKLRKPLGIQFEEVRAGFPGLRVADIIEGGSAIKNEDVVRNLLLLSLNGYDVTGASFEYIMETLANVPVGDEVDLVFRDTSAPAPPQPPPPPPSKPCKIIVYDREGRPVTLNARTGENLRRVLLENKVEVYNLMGKLSNCNGAGQCGTCVVEVEEADGWDKRVPWEGDKLKGRPDTHRLACQAIIKGDAVIATQPPKKL